MTPPHAGRRVALTYDWHERDGDDPPAEGDVLLSHTGTAAYLILSARSVKRRRPEPGVQRWAFLAVRLADRSGVPDLMADGAQVHYIAWYPRRRREVRR